MAKYAIAAVSDFPAGTRRRVTLGGRPIVVFNVKDEYFAILDRCPHQGASLSRGELTGVSKSPRPGCYRMERAGENLRCPWHGWEFDVRTGQSWFDPQGTKVRMYPSNVTSGSQLIEGPYKAETFEVSLEENYVVVEV